MLFMQFDKTYNIMSVLEYHTYQDIIINISACVCTKMSSRKQCSVIQYRHLTLNIPPRVDRLCLIPPLMKMKVFAVTWSNNTEAKMTFSVSVLRQLSEAFLSSVSNCSVFVFCPLALILFWLLRNWNMTNTIRSPERSQNIQLSSFLNTGF